MIIIFKIKILTQIELINRTKNDLLLLLIQIRRTDSEADRKWQTN